MAIATEFQMSIPAPFDAAAEKIASADRLKKIRALTRELDKIRAAEKARGQKLLAALFRVPVAEIEKRS